MEAVLPVIASSAIVMAILTTLLWGQAEARIKKEREHFDRRVDHLLRLLEAKEDHLYRLARLAKASTATEAAGIELSETDRVFDGLTMENRDALKDGQEERDRQAAADLWSEATSAPDDARSQAFREET